MQPRSDVERGFFVSVIAAHRIGVMAAKNVKSQNAYEP
jgi:hypothetical protein